MARTVRAVAVLCCGSSEHAERLPSKADTSIWQVCLKCTLTFISSWTGGKKTHFSSFTRSQSLCSYHFDHVHRPRHGTGSKTSSKFSLMVLLIRKIRILKIEKFAVELYDLNRFFAIFCDFPPKIKLDTGQRLEMTWNTYPFHMTSCVKWVPF